MNKHDEIRARMEAKYELKVNNKKGHNQYTAPAECKKAEVEVFTQETVQQAYREYLIAKRNLLSKAQLFSRANKMFLGLDKVDREMEEKE